MFPNIRQLLQKLYVFAIFDVEKKWMGLVMNENEDEIKPECSREKLYVMYVC